MKKLLALFTLVAVLSAQAGIIRHGSKLLKKTVIKVVKVGKRIVW